MTRRLVVGYLLVTVLVLVMLEVPLGLFYGQREEERFLANAERDAVVLATFYEDLLDVGTPATTRTAEDYAARSSSRVILVDGAGISLIDTGAEVGRDFSTRPEVVEALAGRRSSGIRHSDTLTTDLLYVAVPVASGGTVHGALRTTSDVHELNERIRRFWLGLAAIGAVVLAAVLAVGWAVALSVTRPLRVLQESVGRFARGDLEPVKIDPDVPTEVADLGGAMNTMAGRLAELIAAQRAFTGDASHQLRTPLTALRLRLDNLEAILERPEDRDQVVAALDEIGRLNDLVDDLLRLSRAERPAPAEPVDAAELARDRVEVWSAVGSESGVELVLHAPASAPVTAVPGAIEQVLDNTIDNAIAASTPAPLPGDGTGPRIEVTVEAGPGHTRLVVADSGPGLDDEAKARAVERFWRGDNRRPGTGLGLAIVSSLVTASGGELTLVDNVPHGLVVSASFPTTAAEPTRRPRRPRRPNGTGAA
ncbi:MAG: ATP-binding protein [Acidimicrobiales bacterium]